MTLLLCLLMFDEIIDTFERKLQIKYIIRSLINCTVFELTDVQTDEFAL